MRTQGPPLLPLLRSQVQGNILALTYLHPEHEYSISEAAATVGASVKAVHQEAMRLVDAGILAARKVGNTRLIRSVTGSPLTRPLTDLLAVTYGPMPVLTDALSPIQGVERAFIYGSWAARYHGEPGPVPGDVDVLVIGTADPDVLHDVTRNVEPRLARPVSIRRIRPGTWNSADSTDPFPATLRSRPLVELQLNHETRRKES